MTPFRNPFDSAPAAALYARGRPFYHPLVVARIRRALRLRAPVPLVLDVGCGTGLSAVALAAVAERVVGVDPSPAMLARAVAHPRVEYREGSAEALPLPDASCGLVTAASAFHLFERDAFLREAGRVLRPGGWLVLYDNALTGEARGIPGFRDWLRQMYLLAYPLVAGNREPLGPAEAAARGFRFEREEPYANTVRFTAGDLCDYLLAQANCAAALEAGGASAAEELRDRLLGQVAPLFGRRAGATFRFRGAIRYLRRMED